MRLDKYLCESIDLTRAEAKRLLKGGEVTCDGEVVKNPGFKVADNCNVQMEGHNLQPVGLRYVMIYKPEGCICSTVGDQDYPSVLELLEMEKIDRLGICGRLDVDTTGLVLVTDDGQWSHRITSPQKKCGKRYRVELADPVDASAIEQFAEGIMLASEYKPTRPAELEIISDHEVLLTIHEGKYHQVKRMFAAIGNKVVGLHREQVGEIELDEDLEPGEWRYLTEAEVASV
ncbi:16S rRNA pseudouridine(516) synthase RsuA [Endozoicomonas sp. OPT23]|uniref:16S rRNA pseudouridine(516) synthase RsuA n=1 Tax=Endozoicomonas sp. OPT23 TaxID=2072845 RepID=UPI00129AD5A3|nr:16S rRNA pseudouridine(516) synthase RsuA [Endozoicomonas sp. OPT23]MRI31950.1 16S rRNA pseudouridine(516) synthase RsuA [Endozoicomonas sp. OPT23]